MGAYSPVCQKPMKEYLQRFLEYLEIEKGRSPRTVDNYAFFVKRFLDFAKADSPTSITPQLVRRYKLFLNRYQDKNGNPLEKSSQNHHLIAVRSFLRYLAQQEELEVMPPDRIELIEEGDRKVKVMDESALERFLAAPDPRTPPGLRDKAILELLFSTGLRVSELVGLDVRDINLKTREISVMGKGRKIRVVFVSDSAAEALTNYLNIRQDEYKPLFIRFKGGHPVDPEGWDARLTVRSVERLVKKYALIAGIAVDPTPHTLRHTFATDLLRRGADIRSVQELLGHANIATTQIYTHITNPQLKEIHRKFHRGNK